MTQSKRLYIDLISALNFIFIFLLLCIECCFAQYDPTDPRSSVELTVCSQNLENFGSLKDSLVRNLELTPAAYEEKFSALIKRFVAASCDVIAVQEVLGKKEEEAQEALNSLSARLSRAAGRPFEAKVSREGDGSIRNGFIVANDRASVVNFITYAKVEMPKLLETQKAKIFERAPIEIQLEVKGQKEAESKVVTLLNIHLKSRSGAADDPTGLQFETVRMEMAESIRRLIDIRHAEAFKSSKNIFILLGDRNTGADMAAAKILEGSLALADFKTDGPCRLSKRGLPICKTEARRAQKFFSPLTLDPETKGVAGTYIYQDEASWIDDILLPANALRHALKSVFVEDDYDSGTVSKPKVASDHSLVFVRLNW